MESVATQLERLRVLGGLAEVSSYPNRRVVGSRDGSGNIIFGIANGECLAITMIDCDNIDLSGNPTVAITSNPTLTAYPARPLETVYDVETLYVFGAGTATFTFASIVALPFNTAHLRVSGFILPHSCLNRLKLAALQEIVTS